MTSIYKKKFSTEVRFIYAEQMPLYNFTILREKRDSNTGVFLLVKLSRTMVLLLKTHNILLCNIKEHRA